ncbi:hypothetical protein [Jeotgalibacillus proteolyticus]|uniref:Spore coat protein n=1 Tax=Jeotgalibacillus proteolyticus TaxID=2082395 RepID=A0A2S5GAV5_9BACL|nr:hypothetical protein [Jeotgalibacillus proteolyticus]PPA70120.1 hypothetical protein C4B60_11045 [Jeotgalibacillus proteolyticus]
MQSHSLSTKDAMYLEDILAWNLLAAKKIHFAATQCQTPQVKEELEAACRMHSTHYEMITNFLASNTQSSAQMQ